MKHARSCDARALTHTQGQTRHRGLPINSRIAPGN